VAYKLKTPGNYPEESIQQSEHGESLKSQTACLYFYIYLSNQDNDVLSYQEPVIEPKKYNNNSTFQRLDISLGHCLDG
jgi:hypothetical protein